MGFQDRGYYRSPTAGFAAEWTAVNALIVVTVSVWLADFLLSAAFPQAPRLNDLLCLRSDLPTHPLHAWRLLSYGFVHDDRSPWHILFNMLTLWFFGRPVEAIWGRAEFVRFYLAAIVVAGLAWVVSEQVAGGGTGRLIDAHRLIGASGGVMAALAAFVWYYPRETVLIYGILPLPAWAMGILYFFLDVRGAANPNSPVAHVAHLAGAVFGLLYAWQGWSLAGLTEWPGRLLGGLRRRKLRIVRPDDDRPQAADAEPPLEQEVDRILAKIARSGEASLTREERETLTRASRRLKDRRR